MGEIMFKKFSSVLILLVFGMVSFARAQDPLNPTSFTHNVRKIDYNYYPNLKIKLSIARVHDNKALNTPFGKETGGIEVEVFDSDSAVVRKTPTRYDTSRDEDGYGKKIRELLSYNLTSVYCIQLIEREEINAIIREWDFKDTKYSKKSSQAPSIEIPQIIAKGFMSYNDSSCNVGDDTNEEEAWGVEEKKDRDRLQFLIRLYDTKTSYIKFVACGTGNTMAEAVKNSVKDLKKHRDILLPTVRVTSVKDQRIELDGGLDEGLALGTKFYLVRLEGPKDSIDDYDAIDYIALCKITKSDRAHSLATVEKALSDTKPQKGDTVFYYFPEEGW